MTSSELLAHHCVAPSPTHKAPASGARLQEPSKGEVDTFTNLKIHSAVEPAPWKPLMVTSILLPSAESL